MGFLRYSRLPYRARTQQHRYYGGNVIDPYRALSFYRAALHVMSVIHTAYKELKLKGHITLLILDTKDVKRVKMMNKNVIGIIFSYCCYCTSNV